MEKDVLATKLCSGLDSLEHTSTIHDIAKAVTGDLTHNEAIVDGLVKVIGELGDTQRKVLSCGVVEVTTEEFKKLKDDYPWFTFQARMVKSPGSHGYFRVARLFEHLHIYSMIKPGYAVVEVGGNPQMIHRTLKHLHGATEKASRCVPTNVRFVTDLRDADRLKRQVEDTMSMKDAVGLEILRKDMFGDFRKEKIMCDVVVAMHSTYDFSVEEFVQSMSRVGAHTAYVTRLEFMKVLVSVNTNQKHWHLNGIEVHVKRGDVQNDGDRRGTVEYRFKDGTDQSYVHDLEKILSWSSLTSEYVDDSGRKYYIKREQRSEQTTFVITRVLGDVPQISYVKPAVDGQMSDYVLKYYERSTLSKDLMREKFVLVPAKLWDKIFNYIKAGNKLDMSSITKWVTSLAHQIIVNNSYYDEKNDLDSDEMSCVILATYQLIMMEMMKLSKNKEQFDKYINAVMEVDWGDPEIQKEFYQKRLRRGGDFCGNYSQNRNNDERVAYGENTLCFKKRKDAQFAVETNLGRFNIRSKQDVLDPAFAETGIGEMENGRRRLLKQSVVTSFLRKVSKDVRDLGHKFLALFSSFEGKNRVSAYGAGYVDVIMDSLMVPKVYRVKDMVLKTKRRKIDLQMVRDLLTKEISLRYNENKKRESFAGLLDVLLAKDRWLKTLSITQLVVQTESVTEEVVLFEYFHRIELRKEDEIKSSLEILKHYMIDKTCFEEVQDMRFRETLHKRKLQKKLEEWIAENTEELEAINLDLDGVMMAESMFVLVDNRIGSMISEMLPKPITMQLMKLGELMKRKRGQLLEHCESVSLRFDEGECHIDYRTTSGDGSFKLREPPLRVPFVSRLLNLHFEETITLDEIKRYPQMYDVSFDPINPLLWPMKTCELMYVDKEMNHAKLITLKVFRGERSVRKDKILNGEIHVSDDAESMRELALEVLKNPIQVRKEEMEDLEWRENLIRLSSVGHVYVIGRQEELLAEESYIRISKRPNGMILPYPNVLGKKDDMNDTGRISKSVGVVDVQIEGFQALEGEFKFQDARVETKTVRVRMYDQGWIEKRMVVAVDLTKESYVAPFLLGAHSAVVENLCPPGFKIEGKSGFFEISPKMDLEELGRRESNVRIIERHQGDAIVRGEIFSNYLRPTAGGKKYFLPAFKYTISNGLYEFEEIEEISEDNEEVAGIVERKIIRNEHWTSDMDLESKLMGFYEGKGVLIEVDAIYLEPMEAHVKILKKIEVLPAKTSRLLIPKKFEKFLLTQKPVKDHYVKAIERLMKGLTLSFSQLCPAQLLKKMGKRLWDMYYLEIREFNYWAESVPMMRYHEKSYEENVITEAVPIEDVLSLEKHNRVVHTPAIAKLNGDTFKIKLEGIDSSVCDRCTPLSLRIYDTWECEDFRWYFKLKGFPRNLSVKRSDLFNEINASVWRLRITYQEFDPLNEYEEFRVVLCWMRNDIHENQLECITPREMVDHEIRVVLKVCHDRFGVYVLYNFEGNINRGRIIQLNGKVRTFKTIESFNSIYEEGMLLGVQWERGVVDMYALAHLNEKKHYHDTTLGISTIGKDVLKEVMDKQPWNLMSFMEAIWSSIMKAGEVMLMTIKVWIVHILKKTTTEVEKICQSPCVMRELWKYMNVEDWIFLAWELNNHVHFNGRCLEFDLNGQCYEIIGFGGEVLEEYTRKTAEFLYRTSRHFLFRKKCSLNRKKTFWVCPREETGDFAEFLPFSFLSEEFDTTMECLDPENVRFHKGEVVARTDNWNDIYLELHEPKRVCFGRRDLKDIESFNRCVLLHSEERVVMLATREINGDVDPEFDSEVDTASSVDPEEFMGEEPSAPSLEEEPSAPPLDESYGYYGGTLRYEKMNINKSHTEVIVNAANERLAHGGGIAKAISEWAGPLLQRHCDDYVKENGALKVGDIYESPGFSTGRTIVHAVGPKGKDEGQLRPLYEKIFEHYGRRSITLPLISSGIFGIDPDVSKKALEEAFFAVKPPGEIICVHQGAVAEDQQMLTWEPMPALTSDEETESVKSQNDEVCEEQVPAVPTDNNETGSVSEGSGDTEETVGSSILDVIQDDESLISVMTDVSDDTVQFEDRLETKVICWDLLARPPPEVDDAWKVHVRRNYSVTRTNSRIRIYGFERGLSREHARIMSAICETATVKEYEKASYEEALAALVRGGDGKQIRKYGVLGRVINDHTFEAFRGEDRGNSCCVYDVEACEVVNADIRVQFENGKQVKKEYFSQSVIGKQCVRLKNYPVQAAMRNNVFELLTSAQVMVWTEFVFDVPLMVHHEGVPGCGKTFAILEKLEEDDLVVVMTKEAKGDVEKKVLEKNDSWSRKVFTSASCMMGNAPSFPRILWDEYTLSTAGERMLISKMVGAKELHCYGDKLQIHNVNRVGVREVYSQLDAKNVDNSNHTYRCPQDVVEILKSSYPDGPEMTTSNKVQKSMEAHLIDDIAQVPYAADTTYMTYTQTEKANLSMHLKVDVMTVHEAQGKSVPNVIMVRLQRDDAPIHKGQQNAQGKEVFHAHVLVAVSRHTKSFKYYSVTKDMVFKAIESVPAEFNNYQTTGRSEACKVPRVVSETKIPRKSTRPAKGAENFPIDLDRPELKLINNVRDTPHAIKRGTLVLRRGETRRYDLLMDRNCTWTVILESYAPDEPLLQNILNRTDNVRKYKMNNTTVLRFKKGDMLRRGNRIASIEQMHFEKGEVQLEQLEFSNRLIFRGKTCWNAFKARALDTMVKAFEPKDVERVGVYNSGNWRSLRDDDGRESLVYVLEGNWRMVKVFNTAIGEEQMVEAGKLSGVIFGAAVPKFFPATLPSGIYDLQFDGAVVATRLKDDLPVTFDTRKGRIAVTIDFDKVDHMKKLVKEEPFDRVFARYVEVSGLRPMDYVADMEEQHGLTMGKRAEELCEDEMIECDVRTFILDEIKPRLRCFESTRAVVYARDDPFSTRFFLVSTNKRKNKKVCVSIEGLGNVLEVLENRIRQTMAVLERIIFKAADHKYLEMKCEEYLELCNWKQEEGDTPIALMSKEEISLRWGNEWITYGVKSARLGQIDNPTTVYTTTKRCFNEMLQIDLLYPFFSGCEEESNIQEFAGPYKFGKLKPGEWGLIMAENGTFGGLVDGHWSRDNRGLEMTIAEEKIKQEWEDKGGFLLTKHIFREEIPIVGVQERLVKELASKIDLKCSPLNYSTKVKSFGNANIKEYAEMNKLDVHFIQQMALKIWTKSKVIELHEQNLNTMMGYEALKIPTGEGIEYSIKCFPFYKPKDVQEPYFKPLVETGYRHKRTATGREMMTSIIKRNLRTEISSERISEAVAAKVVEVNLSVYANDNLESNMKAWINDPVDFDENDIKEYLSKKPAHISEKSLDEMERLLVDPRNYKLELKRELKSDPKSNENEVKKCQNLVETLSFINVLMGGVVKKVYDRYRDAQSPNLIITNGRSEEEIEQLMNENILGGVKRVSAYAADLSSCDASNRTNGHLVFMEWLKVLGVSERVRELVWFMSEDTFLKTIERSLVARIKFQTKTGRYDTLAINEMVTTSEQIYAYEELIRNKVWALGEHIERIEDLKFRNRHIDLPMILTKGDDRQIVFLHTEEGDRGPMDKSQQETEFLATSFQQSIKKERKDAVLFCGKFLLMVPWGKSFRYFFVSDPIKKLKKLGTPNIKSMEHMRDFFISVAESTMAFRNVQIIPALAEAVRKEYKLDFDPTPLIVEMGNLGNDFKDFKTMWEPMTVERSRSVVNSLVSRLTRTKFPLILEDMAEAYGLKPESLRKQVNDDSRLALSSTGSGLLRIDLKMDTRKAKRGTKTEIKSVYSSEGLRPGAWYPTKPTQMHVWGQNYENIRDPLNIVKYTIRVYENEYFMDGAKLIKLKKWDVLDMQPLEVDILPKTKPKLRDGVRLVDKFKFEMNYEEEVPTLLEM